VDRLRRVRPRRDQWRPSPSVERAAPPPGIAICCRPIPRRLLAPRTRPYRHRQRQLEHRDQRLVVGVGGDADDEDRAAARLAPRAELLDEGVFQELACDLGREDVGRGFVAERPDLADLEIAKRLGGRTDEGHLRAHVPHLVDHLEVAVVVDRVLDVLFLEDLTHPLVILRGLATNLSPRGGEHRGDETEASEHHQRSRQA